MNQKPTFTSTAMEPVRTVLVTGFEPFGDHATNISQQVVERLKRKLSLSGPWDGREITVSVDTDVLTVDDAGARRLSLIHI